MPKIWVPNTQYKKRHPKSEFLTHNTKKRQNILRSGIYKPKKWCILQKKNTHTQKTDRQNTDNELDRTDNELDNTPTSETEAEDTKYVT